MFDLVEMLALPPLPAEQPESPLCDVQRTSQVVRDDRREVVEAVVLGFESFEPAGCSCPAPSPADFAAEPLGEQADERPFGVGERLGPPVGVGEADRPVEGPVDEDGCADVRRDPLPAVHHGCRGRDGVQVVETHGRFRLRDQRATRPREVDRRPHGRLVVGGTRVGDGAGLQVDVSHGSDGHPEILPPQLEDAFDARLERRVTPDDRLEKRLPDLVSTFDPRRGAPARP